MPKHSAGVASPSWHPRTWPPDRWIALCAVVVSFAALLFAVYQGYLEREHKKLSVRPHIVIAFEWDSVAKEAGWSLLNNGLGPAEMRWFAVSVDGKYQRDWSAVLKAIGLLGEPTGLLPQMPIYPGDLKPAGESPTKLIRFPFGSKTFESVMAVRRHLRVEACYCSLYADCWRVTDAVDSHQVDLRCPSAPPPVLLIGPQ